MIPETRIDWKAFEYIHSNNPERAFENLTYYLFCYEFDRKNGIFRYFNQPYIETEPITVDGKLIGFQSKYYNDSVNMSSKEKELKDAVRGAAATYSGISKLYFYIGKDISPSSKKYNTKPLYQKNIEEVARELGIEIEWRGKSNIEAQLMRNHSYDICRNVFFQADSAVQKCCENLYDHKEDIFNSIRASITYDERKIIIENEKFDCKEFLNSDKQVLVIYGEAGSGKSVFVKQIIADFKDVPVLAFKCTDMDVEDKLKLFSLYGDLNIKDIQRIYGESKNKILYIDAVERYFVLENQNTFEEVLQSFVNAGWKVILTIRTAYKESFCNLILKNDKIIEYHVKLLDYERLTELSYVYGFKLPLDKKFADILRTPFYLGLYLALYNLEDEEMLSLNTETFEKKVWEDVIRNNRVRKNNIPNRREDTLKRIAIEMLSDESYFYVIKSEDDYEALSELEKDGILYLLDDAKRYSYGHDVFEEMVVSKIFSEQYYNNTEAEKFFSQFHTSLRTRKLFRNWLTNIASIKEHQDIIFKLYESKNIDVIWRNEVLLTVISTETLKEVYCKLMSTMDDGDFELLKRVAFLINTCCRVADHTAIYSGSGNLIPFRMSKPSGYAWSVLLTYIEDYKDSISWDGDIISVVIAVLDSWTKHIENAKTENTRMAGEIGFFLFEKISNDFNLEYELKTSQIEKLNDILLNSAWMIKEDLCNIFNNLFECIDNKKEHLKYQINLPKMYIDFAKRAISDVYQYGMMPYAMPEMTLMLMEKLWVRNDSMPIYHSIDLDADFGLVSHISDNYYPASAYSTPVIALLNVDQKSTMDFLIDFLNRAGNAYANSHLNKEYGECFEIAIHVNDADINQIASDRLWKMYRGTHVGPNIIISVLMGIETWLFDEIKKSESDYIVDYCKDILMRSQNVMLTAVIVSIAEAYPEKMIDVICDLLRTKELFHLDSSRYASERTASMLSGNGKFLKERLDNNKLPHRNKRLEEIILNLQINKNGISEYEFNSLRKKVYSAIDGATVDIDSWSTSDKYAYYRMDLRHYRIIDDIHSDKDGNDIYEVLPDFTEDMKKLSAESQEVRNSNFKYMDLLLWSDNKFNNNEKYRENEKYSDTAIVCEELNELWEFLCDFDNVRNTNIDKSLLFYKYISIAAYTSVVLLRDYKGIIDENDKNLCEYIIFDLGNVFIKMSDFDFGQAGNGLEAIVVGLVLLLNKSNIKSIYAQNPLYMLLELVLKDWHSNSCVIKQIETYIWKYNKRCGWCLVKLFSTLADSYKKSIMKNGEITVDEFLDNNNKIVTDILKNGSVKYTDIKFAKLSNIVIFSVISFIPPDIKEAYDIAEITKDIAMKLTFENKRNVTEDSSELIGYTLNYVVWFADVLLHCSKDERKALINSFLERSDIMNDNINSLIMWLINDQEAYGKPKEFWEVWELLMPSMIKISNEESNIIYYSDSNRPTGSDNVIAAYLFANTNLKQGIHRTELLSEEKSVFFDSFIEGSKNVKVLLYAISKLLNTVGFESYKDKGMEWIYKLIQKDSERKIVFYYNTLYYLEEYIGNFVFRHHTEFRTNIELAKKTQRVLEYMIDQGSQIAFFLSEQI